MARASGLRNTPPTTVLVRHGATEWSKAGQHTGRTDLPLLPEGEDDARRVAGRVAEVVGDAEPLLVLCSPLQRALETCRLAGYGERAERCDDLLEWDYGDYEGKTTEAIRAERPGWDLYRDGCPGGESLADVVARTGRVIARLRNDSALSSGAGLLFAHGHVLRVLAATWAGLDGDAARALPLGTGQLGVLGWVHDDPAIAAWNL